MSWIQKEDAEVQNLWTDAELDVGQVYVVQHTDENSLSAQWYWYTDGDCLWTRQITRAHEEMPSNWITRMQAP